MNTFDGWRGEIVKVRRGSRIQVAEVQDLDLIPGLRAVQLINQRWPGDYRSGLLAVRDEDVIEILRPATPRQEN